MRIRTLMCAVYSNQSNRRDGYINIYFFLSDFESDDGWISSKPDIYAGLKRFRIASEYSKTKT